ncbi:MAG: class II aldolase/adducin family protein [Candidatus Omnitrophica bacterium]|nr:class II aldolase/adducin family protein [Candidatus Omnitrophota bacterium]
MNTSPREIKMDRGKIKQLKEEIISTGRLLWEKDLASALNGNISARVQDDVIVITAHATCLGMLKESDLVVMRLNGEVLDGGKVSTEKLMHTEIYKNFPEVKAVVHTHTPYINGYFLNNSQFAPSTFEAKFTLGEVKGIPQSTPSVTDAVPLIEALKSNNIAVLRNHGVVTMGPGLFDCFLFIQTLEEQVKTDAISRLYAGSQVTSHKSQEKSEQRSTSNDQRKKYKLFAQDQIDEIVRLVNADSQLKELGAKTQMNMDLAVQLNETGDVFSFKFQNGQIVDVGKDANAEFLISAPEKVWRSVFNREIDPFVATTQKKMNLRGDFARISRWYAPCSRIFQLWQEVPVE